MQLREIKYSVIVSVVAVYGYTMDTHSTYWIYIKTNDFLPREQRV